MVGHVYPGHWVLMRTRGEAFSGYPKSLQFILAGLPAIGTVIKVYANSFIKHKTKLYIKSIYTHYPIDKTI